MRPKKLKLTWLSSYWLFLTLSTDSKISDETGWLLILMSIYFWHLATTTVFVSCTLFSCSFRLNALSERNLDSSERNCEGRCLGANQSITAATLV